MRWALLLLVSLLAACGPSAPACVVDIVDATCGPEIDGGPEAGRDAGPVDAGPFHTSDGSTCSPPTGACDFLSCCSTPCCLFHYDSGVSAYQCALGDTCP